MKLSMPMRFAAAAVVCALFTGCSSMSTTQKGAAIGGGVGAGAGALWATHHNHPIVSTWEGAGIGALAGVATGALIGDSLNEYSDENAADFLEREALLNDLQRQLAEKDNELEMLRNQPGLENVEVSSVNGQLRFTILNEVLFKSGKTDLLPGSKDTLNSVLALIQQDYPDRDVFIEGHCDSDPITKSKWRDNWELSYNRSMAVVYYYVQEQMVNPERIKAVACSSFHPVAANDTDANKRKNRRAVIVVMPADAAPQVAGL